MHRSIFVLMVCVQKPRFLCLEGGFAQQARMCCAWHPVFLFRQVLDHLKDASVPYLHLAFSDSRASCSLLNTVNKFFPPSGMFLEKASHCDHWCAHGYPSSRPMKSQTHSTALWKAIYALLSSRASSQSVDGPAVNMSPKCLARWARMESSGRSSPSVAIMCAWER